MRIIEFYLMHIFLHPKNNNSQNFSLKKNERFKEAPFYKLRKKGSEKFIIHKIANGSAFSNPSLIQELNLKTFNYDVLDDGKNYAYRIYKNVPTEGLYFYHCDHLMTPLQMTDENQNIVWHVEYYPFGRIYSQSADIENNLRFPGQYSEPDLNLYYNWHRYYSAKIGRYFSKDLLYFNKNQNVYDYSKSNPIIYIDYNGLKVVYCNTLSPPHPNCCDLRAIKEEIKWANYVIENFKKVYIEGKSDESNANLVKCGGPAPMPWVDDRCFSDKCTLWCACVHENTHYNQMNRPTNPLCATAKKFISSGDTKAYEALENDAWNKELNCLRNYEFKRFKAGYERQSIP